MDDFADQKLTPISSREKGCQMFAKLSANGRHVAFVRERNLFAMTKYDGPLVFKLGIAIAPGGDWEMYDTIYTERYMSTPERNPQDYTEASPLNFVARLRDEQELLIVHGDQDDNVHFLSTLRLLTELQKNKKRFQFMLYPGGNHSLQGTGNPLVYFHLFQTLTEFVRENL